MFRLLAKVEETEDILKNFFLFLDSNEETNTNRKNKKLREQKGRLQEEQNQELG